MRWIDDYLDGLRGFDYGRRFYTDAIMAAMTEHGQESVYQQLLLESTLMEINTLRTWLEMARARITARATSEMKGVKDGE